MFGKELVRHPLECDHKSKAYLSLLHTLLDTESSSNRELTKEKFYIDDNFGCDPPGS